MIEFLGRLLWVFFPVLRAFSVERIQVTISCILMYIVLHLHYAYFHEINTVFDFILTKGGHYFWNYTAEIFFGSLFIYIYLFVYCLWRESLENDIVDAGIKKAAQGTVFDKVSARRSYNRAVAFSDVILDNEAFDRRFLPKPYGLIPAGTASYGLLIRNKHLNTQLKILKMHFDFEYATYFRGLFNSWFFNLQIVYTLLFFLAVIVGTILIVFLTSGGLDILIYKLANIRRFGLFVISLRIHLYVYLICKVLLWGIFLAYIAGLAGRELLDDYLPEPDKAKGEDRVLVIDIFFHWLVVLLYALFFYTVAKKYVGYHPTELATYHRIFWYRIKARKYNSLWFVKYIKIRGRPDITLLRFLMLKYRYFMSKYGKLLLNKDSKWSEVVELYNKKKGSAKTFRNYIRYEGFFRPGFEAPIKIKRLRWKDRRYTLDDKLIFSLEDLYNFYSSLRLSDDVEKKLRFTTVNKRQVKYRKYKLKKKRVRKKKRKARKVARLVRRRKKQAAVIRDVNKMNDAVGRETLNDFYKKKEGSTEFFENTFQNIRKMSKLSGTGDVVNTLFKPPFFNLTSRFSLWRYKQPPGQEYDLEKAAINLYNRKQNNIKGKNVVTAAGYNSAYDEYRTVKQTGIFDDGKKSYMLRRYYAKLSKMRQELRAFLRRGHNAFWSSENKVLYRYLYKFNATLEKIRNLFKLKIDFFLGYAETRTYNLIFFSRVKDFVEKKYIKDVINNLPRSGISNYKWLKYTSSKKFSDFLKALGLVPEDFFDNPKLIILFKKIYFKNNCNASVFELILKNIYDKKKTEFNFKDAKRLFGGVLTDKDYYTFCIKAIKLDTYLHSPYLRKLSKIPPIKSIFYFRENGLNYFSADWWWKYFYENILGFDSEPYNTYQKELPNIVIGIADKLSKKSPKVSAPRFNVEVNSKHYAGYMNWKLDKILKLLLYRNLFFFGPAHSNKQFLKDLTSSNEEKSKKLVQAVRDSKYSKYSLIKKRRGG